MALINVGIHFLHQFSLHLSGVTPPRFQPSLPSWFKAENNTNHSWWSGCECSQSKLPPQWLGLWKSPLHGADASSSSWGEFSRGSSRPRVISAEETCRHLHCVSGLLSAQNDERMLNVLGCKRTWKEILKDTIIDLTMVDYCHWKSRCLKWHDLGSKPKLEAALGPQQFVAFFVLLSVDIHRTWVDKHFLEGRQESIILIVAPPFCSNEKNAQFLPECILQPSMVGRIHNHWVLIMCQTIMSQSLASHVRGLALPPLLCYSMQIGKG